MGIYVANQVMIKKGHKIENCPDIRVIDVIEEFGCDITVWFRLEQ